VRRKMIASIALPIGILGVILIFVGLLVFPFSKEEYDGFLKYPKGGAASLLLGGILWGIAMGVLLSR